MECLQVRRDVCGRAAWGADIALRTATAAHSLTTTEQVYYRSQS